MSFVQGLIFTFYGKKEVHFKDWRKKMKHCRPWYLFVGYTLSSIELPIVTHTHTHNNSLGLLNCLDEFEAICTYIFRSFSIIITMIIITKLAPNYEKKHHFSTNKQESSLHPRNPSPMCPGRGTGSPPVPWRRFPPSIPGGGVIVKGSAWMTTTAGATPPSWATTCGTTAAGMQR